MAVLDNSLMNTKEILRHLLDHSKMSEWALSDATGISQSTINAILSGRSKEQRDSTLQPMADYFKISLQQLRGYDPIDGLSDGLRSLELYPVLSDEQIDGVLETGELIHNHYSNFMKSAIPKGPRCFVYVVQDDAMAPMIPRNGRVFVDPDFHLGDAQTTQAIVMIKVAGQYAVRSEWLDLGVKVYKPLSDGFRQVSGSECDFVGYVVGIPESNWTTDEETHKGRALLGNNQSGS
jgi:transcriptional regulator with XRE-family HTH domain